MNKFCLAAALVALSFFHAPAAHAQWVNGNDSMRWQERTDPAYRRAAQDSRYGGYYDGYYESLPVFPLFAWMVPKHHQAGDIDRKTQRQYCGESRGWIPLSYGGCDGTGQQYSAAPVPPAPYSAPKTESYIENGFYVTVVTKPDGSVVTTKTPVRR